MNWCGRQESNLHVPFGSLVYSQVSPPHCSTTTESLNLVGPFWSDVVMLISTQTNGPLPRALRCGINIILPIFLLGSHGIIRSFVFHMRQHASTRYDISRCAACTPLFSFFIERFDPIVSSPKFSGIVTTDEKLIPKLKRTVS